MSGDYTAVEQATDGSTVETPASGSLALFPGTDGNWYLKRPDGTVALLSAFETPNVQTGSAYTLVLTDLLSGVTMNNAGANAVTIPTHASAALPVGCRILIGILGAGVTTVGGAGGVTVHAGARYSSRGQYSILTAWQVATDTWIVE